MTPSRRRSWLLAGAAALVVVLVGGRWIASELAERAWASSVADGQVYVFTRAVARFARGVILLAAVAWGTCNVFLVYRAIGSVQLPRRLGDLEIVEAVPQRVLLAGTITSGLVFGVLLTLGTGDWWMSAWLAARPPHFGVADPLLHRDLGYYVGVLPWLERVQEHLLLAAVSGTVLIALLYVGMGSLRFRRWRPQASAYARAHLGVLLAVTALALAWGAVLDPAETVAGLHGPLGWGALSVRIPSAPLVTALAIMAGVASLVWALRDRATLLVGSWAALLGVAVGAYLVAPGLWRGSSGPDADARLGAERTRLAQLAFGAEARVVAAPPAWPTPEAAVTALPVWDAGRVAAAAERGGAALLGPGRAVAGIALSPERAPSGRASWVVAPMPDLDALARAPSGPGAPTWADVYRGSWAHAGRGVSAIEVDSGLAFAPLGTRDSTAWFGPGFHSFAVAAPDTWPALRAAGIPLTTWWQRTALAWALQSPELVRAETDGLVLLWRRDVAERLHRLAPFATFDAPAPLIADSTLWWVAYGYLESGAFPLVQHQAWQGRPVGYLRAGLLGAVSAASGETRLYLAPGADSFAVAWARILDPLVRPLDGLPAALRSQLGYPLEAFRLAAALVAPPRPEPAPGAPPRADSAAWVARPREPFELVAPVVEGGAEPRLWTAQGFETSTPREFAALVAAAIGPRGPEVFLWRPSPAPRLPAGLVGSPQPPTAPGTLRLWNVGGRLFSEQALFAEAGGGGSGRGRADGAGGTGGAGRGGGGGESRTAIDTVFVTWGERQGQGSTPAAALRDLLAAGRGERLAGDTSLAARWNAVRALAAQADAALSAGDLEAFGRYYRQLRQLLEPGRRALVPVPGPR